MSDVKKIAIVTGATGGIGSACCFALARAGYKVGIQYRSSDEDARALQLELPESFLLKGDLSKAEDIDEICTILKDLGGADVLVNNAGMTADSLLFRGKLEEFDHVVNVNMRSVWYFTKKVARLMVRKSAGRIINISSVVGSTGNPGQTVYGMTKAAIDNFTKSAAMELAPFNILVNSVAPGFIETKMTDKLPQEAKEKIMERIPLKRMGRPEDVASLVKFLATEADYCTGSTFHINGGMYGG